MCRYWYVAWRRARFRQAEAW